MGLSDIGFYNGVPFKGLGLTVIHMATRLYL